MEVQKSIDAVRQQDVLKKSLEIEKLSLSMWYGSRSSVWHTKRIHDTWNNFDSIFDSHL